MCNFCDENELKLKEIEISLRQKDITLKKNYLWYMYEESKMTDVLMNDLFTKSHICMYNPCEENKRKR